MPTADYLRQWRAANPEKRREYNRAYYARHREENAARVRRWRAEHADELRERARRKRQQHAALVAAAAEVTALWAAGPGDDLAAAIARLSALVAAG